MTPEKDPNIHVADQVYFLYDPQPVRMLDVIYVGPVMIYAGIKGKFNPFVKWSLIGVGICTILYNGANFIINEKRAYEKRQADELASKINMNILHEVAEKLEQEKQSEAEQEKSASDFVEQVEKMVNQDI